MHSDRGPHLSIGALLSIPDLAQQVASNVALVQRVFPNVQFYDGEGFSATATWRNGRRFPAEHGTRLPVPMLM